MHQNQTAEWDCWYRQWPTPKTVTIPFIIWGKQLAAADISEISLVTVFLASRVYTPEVPHSYTVSNDTEVEVIWEVHGVTWWDTFVLSFVPATFGYHYSRSNVTIHPKQGSIWVVSGIASFDHKTLDIASFWKCSQMLALVHSISYSTSISSWSQLLMSIHALNCYYHAYL